MQDYSSYFVQIVFLLQVNAILLGCIAGTLTVKLVIQAKNQRNLL